MFCIKVFKYWFIKHMQFLILFVKVFRLFIKNQSQELCIKNFVRKEDAGAKIVK
jgi:hypothetical protein